MIKEDMYDSEFGKGKQKKALGFLLLLVKSR
jgi:hypothetical protein